MYYRRCVTTWCKYTEYTILIKVTVKCLFVTAAVPQAVRADVPGAPGAGGQPVHRGPSPGRGTLPSGREIPQPAAL